jgi:N-methylhydantoinase B
MVYTVPGSERFASRGYTPEQIRERVTPSLRLHTIEDGSAEVVDALTYEIIRHRLVAITDEMGETIKRMSGSIVVTDCNDFDAVLCDEVGQAVQIGLYNTGFGGCADLSVMWTMINRCANPGIAEGDMFLCNDPWVGGGPHQNDVALLAPIFIGGELFSWSVAVAHQVDVGGVTPGSWSVRAEDVFWESLPTPPVKIVKGGVLQADVEDVYLRRSRLPQLVALDLRAKIGANKVAAQEIVKLAVRYGADTVKTVMKRMLDDAESRFRARLSELPEGTWTAISGQEQSMLGDRGVHSVRLAMSNKDGHLTLDFRGTDPQAGMINCTFAGLRFGIMGAVLPLLCGDIPWSPGGITRCISILTDEGTLNNATFPAAVSKASVASAYATLDVVHECIAHMLDAAPEQPVRPMSVCGGTWDLALLAGLSQYETPFVTLFMEPMAGGFGARNDIDGVDTGGYVNIPMGRAPDVEINEFVTPVLYLWRREEPDSGGAGRFRGGVGGSICLVPHDTETPMQSVSSGAGKAVNVNVGAAGGYPGNSQLDVIVRNSRIHEILGRGGIPSRLDELGRDSYIVQCQDETILGPQDVYYMRWTGGGGFGDPLLRDPQLVATDARDGLVSYGAARTLYGVVLTPGRSVDENGTDELRSRLRSGREAAAIRAGNAGQAPGGSDPDRLVSGTRRAVFQCPSCGTGLGELGSPALWDGIPYTVGPAAAAGPAVCATPEIYIDDPVEFRQYVCPSCWTALKSVVALVRDS